ncbi:MAG: S41 family peptidase [Bacteroidota bacterium]
MFKKGIFLIYLCLLSGGFTFAQTASWLRYPAISPDGTQVVFSYKGNLFRVSADGGTATPLTLHQSYDFNPIWSPDGKTIAFASDRNGNFDVYTIPASGGAAMRQTFHSAREVPTDFTADGENVLFGSSIQDVAENSMFPSGVLPELYSVNLETQALDQVLSLPAEDAQVSKDGKTIIYHNRKGYENAWRKHHTSAVARDVMKYDGKNHTYLTTFEGEDRNPVFSTDESTVYFLSERSGTFNVHSFPASDPTKVEQITKFTKHPVRFLSLSNADKMAYSFDGQIYTQEKGGEPKKLDVVIPFDFDGEDVEFKQMGSGASEMAVSPDGKEVAFIIRGEVFVTATEFGTTKRITNTPEQERSVSFSPDGRALLYAGERNGSWNLYQTKLVREEDKHFYDAMVMTEEALLETDAETFQPSYSPDGKEVAFLEERVNLRVLNLESKKTRTVMDKRYNYSYSDGDQWYQWAPDSKWFLVAYSPYHWINSQVGLVAADGKSEPKDLTKSGYSDAIPTWQKDGEVVLWMSDREGFRSHGSWGSQMDVYAMFLTQESYDVFQMDKPEYERWKEVQKDKKKEEKSDEDEDKKEEDDAVKAIEVKWEGLEDRKERLTIHSSFLAGATLNKDMTKLYYLTRFEKGYNLWEHDFREKTTKEVVKMDARSAQMVTDTKKENIFVIADGRIYKIGMGNLQKKGVSFSAEMHLDRTAERAYMFEHAWRQAYKKFYDPEMHGVDWEGYKKEYAKFLPHINNNYDFAEMLSELLGELNASHTGSGYRSYDPAGDRTAALGVFIDWKHEGKGVKIAEVMDKSPLLEGDMPVMDGTIITSINGVEINDPRDYFRELNRKSGDKLLIEFAPAKGDAFTRSVEAISGGMENELRYERWVKKNRERVEKLSNGKLGYVHVRGMNSSSFREVYSEVLGRNAMKEGMVIDTRFNGGGWLHDDLATFFMGDPYVTFSPRGQDFGQDPLAKWNKPSVLVVSESNYSDAHAFPYVYQTLEIGKIVGMPVPGTMTAVWWETLQDNSLYFGIPQVGAKARNGKYLENQQLEPDVKVNNTYDKVLQDEDEQLQKAVEVLLKDIE